MIFFLSSGRLGNQLFQYAFLNSIAKKNENIIALNMKQFTDNFDFDNKKFIIFDLNKNFLGKCFSYLIRKIIKPIILIGLMKLRIIGYIKENQNDTSALPSYKKTNGFLPITFVETGYFQSEDFFDKSKIHFFIKEKYINLAKNIISDIHEDFTKVFIHIRGGDYISQKYLRETNISLPKQYFENAIEIIKKDIKKPYFIFLSDDHSYVENYFSDIENKYVSRNNEIIDLALMTLCEYGVVSNSSFSWWGAYMMKKRKKVIFPKYWYGWKQKIDSHVNIQPKWAEVIEVEVEE